MSCVPRPATASPSWPMTSRSPRCVLGPNVVERRVEVDERRVVVQARVRSRRERPAVRHARCPVACPGAARGTCRRAPTRDGSGSGCRAAAAARLRWSESPSCAYGCGHRLVRRLGRDRQHLPDPRATDPHVGVLRPAPTALATSTLMLYVGTNGSPFSAMYDRYTATITIRIVIVPTRIGLSKISRRRTASVSFEQVVDEALQRLRRRLRPSGAVGGVVRPTTSQPMASRTPRPPTTAPGRRLRTAPDAGPRRRSRRRVRLRRSSAAALRRRRPLRRPSRGAAGPQRTSTASSAAGRISGRLHRLERRLRPIVSAEHPATGLVANVAAEAVVGADQQDRAAGARSRRSAPARRRCST